MCNNQKALLCTWSLFMSALAVAWGSGSLELEIQSDPPIEGKQIFTIRFAPNANVLYDQIVFDCTLQQALVLFTPDGGQENKIYEVGKFSARQRNVKMVKNLDYYVSFFVQLGTQRACDIAGDPKTSTNAPITVPRMLITAYRQDKAVWTLDTKAKGKYRVKEGVGTNAAGTNAALKATE